MPYKPNQFVVLAKQAPISEAFSWLPNKPRLRKFFNLSQAVPSYEPDSSLQTYTATQAKTDGISLYTDILGISELCNALAKDISADYQADVDAHSVAITSGGNQAFSLAMMAIASQGDNVIIPTPCFFNHQMWLDMLGIEVRLLPINLSANALPTINEAAKLIDSNTKAIVLVTPNNPTGAIYPPQLIGQFYDLAACHNIALVLDETYKDFRATSTPAHDLFTRPNWSDTFIHLYSFSKAFAITGYRVGALAGSAQLLQQIEKLMDCIAICAPHISQRAALYGLSNLAAWKRHMANLMLARHDALIKALAHSNSGYEVISSGAFFAYLRHPFQGHKARDVAKWLADEHDMLLLPGSMFGPDQENYLRLAFANVETDQMPEIALRLTDSNAPGQTPIKT